MEMYNPKPEQEWSSDFDLELAKSYIGKSLLFGISYVDQQGQLLQQIQDYGEITQITSEVIEVKLHGSEELFTLPPFVDELELAPPGEYTLRATGELVTNPDLIGRFRCISPAT